MFPHATCLCVNAAQKCERHNHYQRHQEECDREESPKHPRGNSWIIQRHVDFVEINVVSPSKVSSILRHSQHQLCIRQVSLYIGFSLESS